MTNRREATFFEGNIRINSIILLLIALLDDIAVLVKAALAKSIGIVGDDMAAGAQGMAGMAQEREIPVVLKIMKGSFVNKLILIAAGMALLFVAPGLVNPLLLAGGLFLAYEGIEGLLSHEGEEGSAPSEDERVRQAVKFDFVLSGEIIVVTMGMITDQPILKQLTVLGVVGILMTLVVYLSVMLLVRLDNIANWFIGKDVVLSQKFGRMMLVAAEKIIGSLGVIGSAAMILVGGGLLLHTTPEILHSLDILASVQHSLHHVAELSTRILFGETLLSMVAGCLGGGLIIAGHQMVERVKGH